MSDARDISLLSFEEAMAELEAIVAELESGEAPLERSIEVYERGAALRSHCEGKLRQARLRVESILAGPDGAPIGLEPAELS